MTPTTIVMMIAGYFVLLIIIAALTGKVKNNTDFFLAGRNAPWYLVAFGMIGASLSGVTFISIPGKVGIENDGGVLVDQFSYMQIVLGYLAGYVFIALVLLPVYYRMNLTSIYRYLDERFGTAAWKTGAFFFIISRTVGSAIRLLLVANVLQAFVFDAWGVPFVLTVTMSILLIWVYTRKGGMKTIIYTDTLQTLFMLISLVLSIVMISQHLEFKASDAWHAMTESPYSQWFFFDNFATNNYHFIKQFIGGFFICIGMTGMDQDMMQKNLACKNIREAQKNMLTFAATLLLVNFLFLGLGSLLYLFAQDQGIVLPLTAQGRPNTDLLFPIIALESEIGGLLSIFFILGLTAAAYSSADSTLTSLTTSVSVDFLNIEEADARQQQRMRKRVHILVSLMLLATILVLHYTLDLTAIDQVIVLAGFTYGPLIGIFLFGLTTGWRVHGAAIIGIALAAPVVTFFTLSLSPAWLGGFTFGPMHIALNAAITFAALFVASFFKARQ